MKNETSFSFRTAKIVGKAINDYSMIENNDKVLIGFSGGKDSFTLMDILSSRRKRLPINYELYALLVVLNSPCSNEIDIDYIRKECEKRDVTFVTKKINIEEAQRSECFWCSWNRRKLLFNACDELKCNKLALGHHKDDIIETLLLNLFYHGEFSTMPPKLEFFEGKITLIRPLSYIEEKICIRYAKEHNFKAESCNKDFLSKTNRQMIKEIIKDLKIKMPSLKGNLFNSMKKEFKTDYLI